MMKRILSTILPLLIFSVHLAGQWVPKGIHLSASSTPRLGPVNSIVADGHGGAYVVWHASAGGSNIYIQRVSSEGRELWQGHGGMLVCKDGAFPNIIANGDSGVFVAWEATDNIRLQKLDLDGRFLWDSSGILCSRDTRGGSGAQLAIDGAGGVMVSWHGVDPGGIGWSVPRAQRFDANGLRLWGETAITLSDRTFGMHTYDVPIVSDGTTGGAVVCWHENSHAGADTSRTFAQRIDAAGRIRWQQNGVPLSDSLTSDRGYLFAASDNAGGVFVAWYSLGYQMIQHLDSAGSRLIGKNGLILGRGFCVNLLPDGSGGVFMLTHCLDEVKRLQHVDARNSLLLGVSPLTGVQLEGPVGTERLSLDGTGGFFVAVAHISGITRWDALQCQHVDSSGKNQFNGDGVELAATVEELPSIDMASTAPLEAMVVWVDSRSEPALSGGIYIGKINNGGLVSVPPLFAEEGRTLAVLGPYPNPVASTAVITCRLSAHTAVRVTLSDLVGREIGILYEGEQPPGEFFVPIDTSPLAPGSYFIVAKAGEETRTTRLVVARR